MVLYFVLIVVKQQGGDEMEVEEYRGPEDAADVAEARREQREQDERDELARRSTVLKVSRMRFV